MVPIKKRGRRKLAVLRGGGDRISIPPISNVSERGEGEERIVKWAIQTQGDKVTVVSKS